MTSKLTEILIDCTDAERLAEFWCAVLGWKVIDRDEDDVEIGDGTDGPSIVFEPVPERKTIKNRIHLDVNAPTATRTPRSSGSSRSVRGGSTSARAT